MNGLLEVRPHRGELSPYAPVRSTSWVRPLEAPPDHQLDRRLHHHRDRLHRIGVLRFHRDRG